MVEAAPGSDYEFVVDGEPLPDPCSRWQPEGLRGPSRVFDPGAFAWTDNAFRTPGLHDAVIYELHVGTFSPEGTFAGAIPYLQGLADLGVTVLELMPVAEFPGARGWSYDGVYLSAAQSSYGGPEALQQLVDAAHAVGLAVVLDVVYNHVGASGNKAVLAYGPYFTHKHETPWGASLNVDGEHSRRRPRVGLPERRAVDPRLPPRRPAAGRDPRDLRLQPRAPRGRGRAPRARRSTRARS